MKAFILLISVTLFGSVHAAPFAGGRNLLVCQDFFGMDSNCKLSEPALDLIDKRSIHSSFIVDYAFSCAGSMQNLDVGIELVSDAYSKRLVTVSSGPISFEGYGPVRLTSTNPVLLGQFKFSRGCTLIINDITVSPSDTTISYWQNEQLHLEEKIRDATAARDAYQELSLLVPALGLLSKLAENLEADVAKERDLRELLNEISKCDVMDINPLLPCNVFEKIVNSSNEAFTIDEKSSINRLIRVMDRLPQLTTCDESCDSVVLSDYLSTDDKIRILAVANKIADANHAEEMYRYYVNQTTLYEEALNQLRVNAGEWL